MPTVVADDDDIPTMAPHGDEGGDGGEEGHDGSPKREVDDDSGDDERTESPTETVADAIPLPAEAGASGPSTSGSSTMYVLILIVVGGAMVFFASGYIGRQQGQRGPTRAAGRGAFVPLPTADDDEIHYRDEEAHSA